MIDNSQKPSRCCGGSQTKDNGRANPLEMLPMYSPPKAELMSPHNVTCCGAPAGPPISDYAKAGYAISDFVTCFLDSPVGPVPCVSTKLAYPDFIGTMRVRIGIRRNNYKVAPGLYALGTPDAEAPVLVTANYKLSFDHLRSRLIGIDAWLLVLDTRGINVWCAAGKGTFGTDEIIRRVAQTRLSSVVRHRRLILPQLGAPGVAAQQVKEKCGFEVVWGPVRASDFPAFLALGNRADADMRRVTFTIGERMILIPVELLLSCKPLFWTLLIVFALSGIGPRFFSFSLAWQRGSSAALACIAGIVAGRIAVPILLPWIPGRAFAFKGALAGFVLGGLYAGVATVENQFYLLPTAALVLFSTVVSSFLAMDFTGSTPFTSPTGVEKEMRLAIPLQLTGSLLAAALWIVSAFF